MPVNFHLNRLTAFLCHRWIILPVVVVVVVVVAVVVGDVAVAAVVVAIYVASAFALFMHLQTCLNTQIARRRRL